MRFDVADSLNLKRIFLHLVAMLPARWQGITEAERTYRINRTLSRRSWLRQYKRTLDG